MIRVPGREEIGQIYDAGREAVIDTILALYEQIQALSERVQVLEEQLARNSQNSSKPPSSDRFGGQKPAPKSRRTKSGKRPGGQKGHPGQTLRMTESPDRIEILPVKTCQECGHTFGHEPAGQYESRQVFDIEIRTVVTEYRAESRKCPCGCTTRAAFPDGVKQRAQYGRNMQSLLVYLNQYQLVPYARTVEFIRDMTGHSISEGTLFNCITNCRSNLEPFQKRMKQLLIGAPVVGFDETGVQCAGALHWIHTACTEKLTLLEAHRCRGYEAMMEIGILPTFRGIAVHDYMKSYYRFENCQHALCGGHIVRELQFIIDCSKRKWASAIQKILLRMERATDNARERGKEQMDHRQRKKLEAEYDRAVLKACRSERHNRQRTGSRGRIRQSKGRNLAIRLRDRRDDVLRFLSDLSVPFTNNNSERSFRMEKTQQKISGCFRSIAGAQIHCAIRSYIDTAKKNGLPVMGALKDSVSGNPFLPPDPALLTI